MTKPILTRKHVDAFVRCEDDDPRYTFEVNALNTIEQAVELLRREKKLLKYSDAVQWAADRDAFLARYDGTNTNGKDGE